MLDRIVLFYQLTNPKLYKVIFYKIVRWWGKLDGRNGLWLI
jgi:hypothetical protein